MKVLTLITTWSLGVLFFVVSVWAAPNPTINYQGKLTDATGLAVPDGTYNMRFYLYDNPTVATTSAIWTETLTSGNQVQVTNGLFSVMLGSTTSFASQNVDFNQTLYLGIEIGGSTTLAWDGEMSPRKVLGTVPAAFVAYDALDSAALGGVASTSFLRSDQADTASGLLTFTGGFISNSSSTISGLTFGTATGTTIIINGDRVTDFTGAGLTNTNGALSVATSSLNINFNEMIGTLAVAQGGTGSTTPTGFLFGDGAGALDSISLITSSYLEDVFLRNDGDDTTTGKLTINGGLLSLASSTIGNGTAAGGLTIDGNATTTGSLLVEGTGDSYIMGNVGIGTTSPLNAKLTIDRRGFSGAGRIGLEQYLATANSVNAAVQYGNYFNLDAANNTATTTIVGSMVRIDDDTTFGNVVRGLEVQADRGVNTNGENTALSGIARTFGVRGITRGNAGGVYEPAGGFFETEGTTQGNAVRGYSDTITTASLLSLFQASSSFAGTGLEMNFGNSGGSFASTSSRFLDFQIANATVFSVSAYGTTTIGDGTRQAGLQISRGGICVDNDGSCTASTTGRISAIDYDTGNSDLAEVYFSANDLESGEVVSIVGGLSVDRAARESSLPVLGVVSTKPGLTLGFDDSSLEEGESGYPIALSGRVPVKLSTENGPIMAGDKLMLSSLPGVAVKAIGTGQIIGMALEAFDGARRYSDTYINQFGDDMVDPAFEPVISNLDPRVDDGCYYGGGLEIGEPICTPLISDTESGRLEEANQLARAESVAEALADLKVKKSEQVTLTNGQVVQVGQIVMFVEREYRWVDEETAGALAALVSSSSLATTGANEEETLFDRLIALANGFVDGVLSIFELRVNRVEVSEELCVDGVCVTAEDLRSLLDIRLDETGSTTEVDDDDRGVGSTEIDYSTESSGGDETIYSSMGSEDQAQEVSPSASSDDNSLLENEEVPLVTDSENVDHELLELEASENSPNPDSVTNILHDEQSIEIIESAKEGAVRPEEEIVVEEDYVVE